MFKKLTLISLGFICSMANAAVLVDVPGLGNTSIGCTPQCAISTSITFTTPYDPSQSLWNQVDNAGVPDGNSIIFSQGSIAPTTGKATHIQWNGLGNPGLGFVIGVWDLSVPTTKGAGGMPGFPANFGNTNITGPQIAKLSLPINQIATSAAASSMTHFDATIPALLLTAGHNYAISIVAIGYTPWQLEIAANCSSSNYTGCIMNASSGLGASTMVIMGGNIYHAAPVAFQFTNDDVATVSTPAVPPVINTTALPAATVGATYSANISSTVPAGDNATVAITGLPSGLSFDTATNNITGAASVIGNFSVNVTVADATTKLSTSSLLSLTVNDNVLGFTPVNLPDATTNSAYTAMFNVATGGYGSFTYTATGLPTGISITGNTLSGTPTAAGLYAITLSATDSVGVSTSANVTLNVIDPVAAPVACSGSNAVITAYVARNPGYITVNGGLNLLDHLWTNNLNAGNTTFNGGLVNWYSTGAIVNWTGTVDPAGCILDHLTVSPRVAISTSTLPNGVTGNAYTAPVTVAWGVAPYSTSVLGLPAGLSFDGVSVIGTPTVAGTFTVSVNTTDSLGVSAASAPITLTISAPAISSFSATLPSGTVGTAYSGSVSATGGYGTLNYVATGLPAGLTLSGKNIVGTPTAAGTYSVAFTVTDLLGTSKSTSGGITVGSAVAATGDPSCVKPAGGTGGLNSKGAITAINGNVITFKTSKGLSVVVTVPSCAKIAWNGGAKAFALGQVFEWNGYSSAATGNVAQSVTIN